MRFISMAVLVVWIFSSCVATRPPIQYLEQGFDTAAYRNAHWQDLKFKPGDILSIKVYSDNAQAAAVYNEGGGYVTSTMVNAEGGRPQGVPEQGYLVNLDGKVNMIGIGSITVSGLTGRELSAKLVGYFQEKNLLSNPSVDIKLMNFRVTVSGEVIHPGVYPISSDRVNIIQVLAMAGDLTNYAKRERVTIMRERDGIRSFGTLDMNDATIFKSPFFQLEQNDVIMVPANKLKDKESDQITYRNVSLSLNFLSLLTILAVNVF